MTSINKSRIFILVVVVIMFSMISSSAIAQSSVKRNPQRAARIDVCFLLDSTGSMSDEIQVVKDKIWEIVNEILLGDPRPDVRFSIVTYRDKGDEYVVKNIPFTRDVDSIHSDLMNIKADGGGDKREDVNQGFGIAVNDLDWDRSSQVARMIFLIGDAGPHMEYSQSVPYHTTAQAATNMGIQVFSIGCSGIDQNEITEFTEIASLTGGSFEYLTYKMDIEQDGEKKTLLITGDDASIAEPEALDEKEWRRGAEELKSKGKVRSADKEEFFSYKDSAGRDIKADADDLTNTGSTSSMENNLDLVIQRQIQIQAEKQGAKYDDSELDTGLDVKENGKKKDPWYVNVANWFKSLFGG